MSPLKLVSVIALLAITLSCKTSGPHQATQSASLDYKDYKDYKAEGPTLGCRRVVVSPEFRYVVWRLETLPDHKLLNPDLSSVANDDQRNLQECRDALRRVRNGFVCNPYRVYDDNGSIITHEHLTRSRLYRFDPISVQIVDNQQLISNESCAELIDNYDPATGKTCGMLRLEQDDPSYYLVNTFQPGNRYARKFAQLEDCLKELHAEPQKPDPSKDGCSGGKRIGDGCWFLGQIGESCQSVCTRNKLKSSPLTVTAIGDQGTDAMCLTVAAAFDKAQTFGPACQGCSFPVGCAYNESQRMSYRSVQNPTESWGTAPDYSRFCACE
jgi:hypothetical protein